MPGLSGGNIEVLGADTDSSPYDSGSYASSTTYVTGKAVEKACQKLITRILEIASGMLDAPVEELEFASDRVEWPKARSLVSHDRYWYEINSVEMAVHWKRQER